MYNYDNERLTKKPKYDLQWPIHLSYNIKGNGSRVEKVGER
jgi:hypothetical protein